MNKKGFTLVELLAVIVIIGILGIITIPNVLNYFNESKREAMIIQESKLVESGDILVRDYCKKPINGQYQLECDELYKPLKNASDEAIIDSDPSTYTRYICLSTLKDKEYYSEKLQYSGVDCSGVVVYRIDENTDIQKESFSVVKCGSDYKTIFETEDAEDFDEFLENDTRADKLSEVFKECFSPEETPPGTGEEKKEYLLTINYTEHNPTGQQVADTISKKIKTGDPIGSYNIPEYKTGTGENEEHYTAFVHSSTTKEHGLSINLNGKTISGTMPAKDVTINIVYSINQYTVTFVHKDAVLGTNTFGGTTHTNNTYELFNGENVKIPYKEIENFKVVSHNTDTQSHYTLDTHSDKEIEILYQQINFNLSYNENGGSTCTDGKTEYKKKFGTLCTTTRAGYTFAGWYLNDTKVTSETTNNTYSDITLEAKWTANEYQITYHMGNGTSEPGSTVLGTKKCTYDQACTLDTFTSLGTEFLYSSDPNYGWGFAGWMTDGSAKTPSNTSIVYTDNATFTYQTANNINLYALGKRTLRINRGIKPTTYTGIEQYWNPNSTSTDYLSNITLPSSTAIGNGWTFRGYKGGSTESNISTVTFSSDKAGTTFKANYNVYPHIRSIYERTLTMKYEGNGSTSGSTSNQTTTQYYSSGYASGNKNYKEQISEPTITLRANGFTKTGYTFKNWAKGSTTGTQYSASSNYTFAPGVSTTNTETMYALWEGNTYYVAYDCNGGTGTMEKSEHKYDVEKALNANKCEKGGYLFSNWNTKADNTGTAYGNKANVKNLTSGQTTEITLFAQYSRCGVGTYAEAGATSCTSCPTGYTSLAGSDEISDCYLTTTAGNYVASANQNQTQCAANGYCSGGTKVYYGNTGGRTACPTNYGTSPAGSDAAADCYLTTTAGNYVATATQNQTQCASNGYCPGNVKVYYNSTGGRTGCPTNYGASPAGSDAAADCYLTTTAGNYVATAKQNQTQCAANGYCAGGTKVYYGNTGGRSNCPTNYGTSPAGSDADTDCYLTTTAGKYVATAKGTQVTCTVNYYCTGGAKVNYGLTGGRLACGTCKTSAAGATACTTRTYAVTYNMNGGTGGPSTQIKTCGTNLTLSTSKPSKSGYAFDGWKATNGTAYSSGGTYSTDAATTMTAQWKQNTVTYTATFIQNGAQSIGSTKQTCTATVGGTCTITTPTITPKSGFTQLGWSTESTPKDSLGYSLSKGRETALNLSSSNPCKNCSLEANATLTLSADATYYAITISNDMYYIYYKKNSIYANTTADKVVYGPYVSQWGCHRINGESSCELGLSFDMWTYVDRILNDDTLFQVTGYSKTDNSKTKDYSDYNEKLTMTSNITLYLIVEPWDIYTCQGKNAIYDKDSQEQVAECNTSTSKYFIGEDWAYMPNDTTCENKVYLYGYIEGDSSNKGWMCSYKTRGGRY